MNLIYVRYFDDMYVVIPLVVSCERRLHDTHKGPIWIQKFNAMARFYLNTFLVVTDACEGVNHK